MLGDYMLTDTVKIAFCKVVYLFLLLHSKLSGFQQDKLLFYSFHESEIEAQVNWVPCSGVTR